MKRKLGMSKKKSTAQWYEDDNGDWGIEIPVKELPENFRRAWNTVADRGIDPHSLITDEVNEFEGKPAIQTDMRKLLAAASN
jgi:hypothetical protein